MCTMDEEALNLIYARANSRRKLFDAQAEMGEIQFELSNQIREICKSHGLVEFVAGLQDTNPALYKYIRRLELLNTNIWCDTCQSSKRHHDIEQLHDDFVVAPINTEVNTEVNTETAETTTTDTSETNAAPKTTGTSNATDICQYNYCDNVKNGDDSYNNIAPHNSLNVSSDSGDKKSKYPFRRPKSVEIDVAAELAKLSRRQKKQEKRISKLEALTGTRVSASDLLS